jgi:NADPH:quinone reductase-like Zn-dependent oxidoreductase
LSESRQSAANSWLTGGSPARSRVSQDSIWAGKRLRPTAFRNRLRADLTQVLQLLADGILFPQIAAEFPLAEAGSALALAESRTVAGKVVIVAETGRS